MAGILSKNALQGKRVAVLTEALEMASLKPGVYEIVKTYFASVKQF